MHGTSSQSALRLRITLEDIEPPESLDQDDRQFVEWAGDDFDPEQFDVSQARHALMLSAAWGCLKGR